MIVNIVDVPGGQKRYLHIIFTKSVQKKLNNNNIFFFKITEMNAPLSVYQAYPCHICCRAVVACSTCCIISGA